MDSFAQKAHFWRRASRGATLDELEKSDSPQALLDSWLHEPVPAVQTLTLDPLVQKGSSPLSEQERKESLRQLRLSGQKVASWLLDQMVTAPNPLHESVTNFWREHFVVSIRKVKVPHFILDYDRRLRTYALGDFRDLLWAVTTSPAMLFYLDNQQNRAGKPNENYSREVMELFTLGRGNYTEKDVQEGARALTGWTIDRTQFQAGEINGTFVPRRHDTGSKTYLGRTGPLKAEDVVDILANHPRTGEFLSRKLWTYFVYPDPDPSLIERLSQVYRSSNRNIAALVDAVFSSPEFYSPQAYRSRIKSPQDFLLGSIRQLQIKAFYPKVTQNLRTMGQAPYLAPSVKGWPSSWLDTTALLSRLSLAEQLTQDYGDEGSFQFDPQRYTATDLLTVLLDGNPPREFELPQADLSIREVATLIVSSPTYQLA